MDVGSGSHWKFDLSGVITKTKPGQMFVMIGDEWKVFNLRKLYEEVKAGVTQASLFEEAMP